MMLCDKTTEHSRNKSQDANATMCLLCKLVKKADVVFWKRLPPGGLRVNVSQDHCLGKISLNCQNPESTVTEVEDFYPPSR